LSGEGHVGGNGADSLQATRVFLRPLANPLSLGFLGLFFATMVLASMELGWVPTSESHLLAIGVLVFSVPLQIISCFYGFLVRDPACATGMGVQAGIWAMVGVVHLVSKPGSTTAALGLMLVMGVFAVAIPALGAATSKVLAAIVMCTTGVRWAVTAGYEWSSNPTWKTAGGAAGLLLAALALYASLAFELEDQKRKTLLPTLRRSSGVKAMTGPLAEQVDKVANEAGVRKQL
jgi:succinate-acetate transporter protein